MPYSQFTTIGTVKTAFGLTVVEGDRFFPEIPHLHHLDGRIEVIEI